jgi:hypothetical protein
MTGAERKRIARYIRTVANTLGLRDWTLNLAHDEPDDKEAYASVSCVYGRRIANLWLAHGFEMLEPIEQRHVIVHELLHIHFDRTLKQSEGALPGLLGAASYAVYEAGLRESIEHGVDAVADALAGALPLPE